MKTKLLLSIFVLFLAVSAAFSQSDSKKTEMMKTRISNAYDVFNSYDYDKLNEYIDDNFIEHSPDPGQKQGLDGLKDAFRNLKKGFPDYKLTINDIIVSGDKASVLFTFSGTNSGEMMGMRPTNKSVSVQGIDYLYFKNGKCSEHWGYMDMHNFMEQLGMSKDNK
jgi:steroid delta-isomerase-like uncharacterized protein